MAETVALNVIEFHSGVRRPGAGGESFTEMKARVLEAFTVIREVHADQTVAVVSHGGVNRIVLAQALGVDARSIFHMDQSHAGVSIIDDYEDYSVVRFMNVTC